VRKDNPQRLVGSSPARFPAGQIGQSPPAISAIKLQAIKLQLLLPKR
jgi:hypothetical protein